MSKIMQSELKFHPGLLHPLNMFLRDQAQVHACCGISVSNAGADVNVMLMTKPSTFLSFQVGRTVLFSFL